MIRSEEWKVFMIRAALPRDSFGVEGPEVAEADPSESPVDTNTANG
jgi:hypothetical protein